MLTSFDNLSFLKILSFLKAHGSEFLSGQDMSEVLKISRVAVWKDIKKIRSLGYKVESKQNIGYRLIDSSKLPLPWEIKENLNTRFLGNRIYYFNTIDTTQNFAMKIASKKNEDGSVVISKKQTGGRGRMKRKWRSPVGGIWMSVIIHPEFDVTHATLVKKNENMSPLIKQFLYELEKVLALINSSQIKKIRNEWTKRSSTIGRNVSIITNEGRVNGKAIKIDNDGGLIISNGKKTKKVLVGDVKE